MVYNKNESNDDSSESKVALINLPPQQIVTFVADACNGPKYWHVLTQTWTWPKSMWAVEHVFRLWTILNSNYYDHCCDCSIGNDNKTHNTNINETKQFNS